MSCIAIIPARGGSRRIPRKNIKLFHGKPIIAYSIETAKASGLFYRIIVSTDDDEIAGVATEYGAEIHKRSAEMSRDEVGTQLVTRHALLQLRKRNRTYLLACCLYPTAPMLNPEYLREARKILLFNHETNYVVPVGEWLYDPGQFYFGKADAFLSNRALLSPRTMLLPIDPATCCDINTLDDWSRAEAMYAKLHGINHD